MKFSRVSGILLHPTSLPGKFGIGDLGPAAYSFVNFMIETKQKLWQLLPLSSPGNGERPYQSYSAFGCNALLISLEKWVDEGFLDIADLDNIPTFPKDKVDFNKVIKFKEVIFRKGYKNFLERADSAYKQFLSNFCFENSWWLDDFAFYMALKEYHNGKPWFKWEKDIAFRNSKYLKDARDILKEEINFHKFLQCQFFKQWFELKKYCNDNGIKIIGDIPIFVSHDSADVWANPNLFYLDENGNPTVVAGVPPDYFSTTGQLWGNPLYRWDVMEENGYEWWTARFKMTLALVDIIRIDHFRGFEAYWEIPADEDTAINGKWVKGPGEKFFTALKAAIGDPSIIAEDLGLITDEVEELRDQFGFPGMKVLQFAFSDSTNEYLPHNYIRNCVVYTGTHDNNTTIGWFNPNEEDSTQDFDEVKKSLDFALKYLGSDGNEIHWDMIKLALASVADMAIIPMQDILGLGADARMNIPGTADGNWAWRYRSEMITKKIIKRLKTLTELFSR